MVISVSSVQDESASDIARTDAKISITEMIFFIFISLLFYDFKGKVSLAPIVSALIFRVFGNVDDEI